MTKHHRFLFLTSSDLAPTDANGRTLRDVFGFVEDSDAYVFCNYRANPSLETNHVFCISDRAAMKGPFARGFFQEIKERGDAFLSKPSAPTKKNPLSCLLRNWVWSFSSLFWKRKVVKWAKSNNIDVIVLNPGDFSFFHFLAVYLSKKIGAKLVLYNTEDYYFKTWNYLHDENGFKRLYALHRKQLMRAYKASIGKSSLCIYNVEGLQEIYQKEFPRSIHRTIYHPSSIRGQTKDYSTSSPTFYYCGLLDKGRDKVFVELVKGIHSVFPDSKIVVNSRYKGFFNEAFTRDKSYIDFRGMVPYSSVAKELEKSLVVISVSSFDSYNQKDKFFVFSTKISDYIASNNIIFHVGPLNTESIVLNMHKMAYVASSENDIDEKLNRLKNDLANHDLRVLQNQRSFYEAFLNPRVCSKKLCDFLDEFVYGE